MSQLDVRPWFRSDLVCLLLGMMFMDSKREESDQYRAGFMDALTTLCLLCGISPRRIGIDEVENDRQET